MRDCPCARVNGFVSAVQIQFGTGVSSLLKVRVLVLCQRRDEILISRAQDFLQLRF